MGCSHQNRKHMSDKVAGHSYRKQDNAVHDKTL